MELEIPHQATYSRWQLLLRLSAGPLYIMLPHALLLMVPVLVSLPLLVVAWGAVLFTGRFPEKLFVFELGLMRWQLRVNARLYQLVDGYPPFGFTEQGDAVRLSMERAVFQSRTHLLLRIAFGWLYCLIPHGVALLMRWFVSLVMMGVAAVAVLATCRYPERLHRYNVGTLRWSLRVRLYMSGMTDQYPAFGG